MKSYYLLVFAIVAIIFFWIINLNPNVMSQVHNGQRSDVANKMSPPIQKNTETRYNEAIKYYDKALAIEPNATNILNNKGIVLTKLGKYGEAIKLFDRILSLDPKNVPGLYNKGVVLDKIGNHIAATQYQQRALQINPNYHGDFINRLTVVTSTSLSEDKSK
jgi:tetratricopeptide (TPR) repeat protein